MRISTRSVVMFAHIYFQLFTLYFFFFYFDSAYLGFPVSLILCFKNNIAKVNNTQGFIKYQSPGVSIIQSHKGIRAQWKKLHIGKWG